jgi:F-type H+-transporting ATPase subunit epsilon
MEKLFKVNILTAQKIVYFGEASSLIAPGELGYLGILADHAPLLTSLVPGRILIRDASGGHSVINSKGNGFLEALKNNITLLLDEIGLDK